MACESLWAPGRSLKGSILCIHSQRDHESESECEVGSVRIVFAKVVQVTSRDGLRRGAVVESREDESVMTRNPGGADGEKWLMQHVILRQVYLDPCIFFQIVDFFLEFED